ncbi:hypothetical protein J2X46_002689 [Nocardioides sp. BE266]|uniref:hypothetical protein n=1 Tax=Nocardioides sp. BE266 TaxID=2817725 RepID=UPI00285C78BE|nr:hypothetical protein [Nocardioides sp. BE266]MDR7253699.1 hypothetical protein [Nocardioides sp. BE266]
MRFLAALLLAVVLTGCGHEPATRTAPDLAGELGCTGGDGDDYAVACDFEGSRLSIRSFMDAGERDAYVNAATNFTNVLVGEGFVIEAPDTATLDEARKIVGGEIMGAATSPVAPQ